MKFSAVLTGTAAAILLCTTFVAPATAGSLTIDEGPSFLPGSSFTDNSIDAVVRHNPAGLVGDVARLYGDAMVSPSLVPSRVLLEGSFAAQPGDSFSVSYDFLANLNSTEPITITLGAQTIVAGVPQIFNTTLTINPGQGEYSGQVSGPTFDLATSGTWKGHVYFNLAAPSQGGTEAPDPGDLAVRLRGVDFQLVAVPEPSSLVSLLLGAAALGFVCWRRRQLA